MAGQKTYWHLLGNKRRPSDYDIATSRLLYYPYTGFEVRHPLKAWYETYQSESRLRCEDWERFADPRQTTYAKYTALQRSKVEFVQALFRSIEESGHDQTLSEKWRHEQADFLASVLFPCHGLQMAAAYVGHMAPASRIVIAAALQTADEIRRIQTLAYRLRQLQQTSPGVGATGRDVWQTHPSWQPLRELIEKLLVAYDWGEAFVALNLVVKPAFDSLFADHWAKRARAAGDYLFAEILGSLAEDSRWQQSWSAALVATSTQEREANTAVIAEWRERWQAPTQQALEALTA